MSPSPLSISSASRSHTAAPTWGHGVAFAVVALGLVMTALTVREVRLPRTMTIGDHVIAVFVLSMSALAIVSGLMLLVADTLP